MDRYGQPMLRSLLVSFLFGTLLASHAAARVELTPCKNKLSPEEQIQLGQKVVAQVYAQMPILPDSSPVTAYVRQLGQKLTSQAPSYKWPYNFHVANVAEINAFALPGGSVFVNLGTIQAAENEAQLAGVMAHEISHVVLQHSVCNALRQQKVGLLAGLGQVAAGVILGGAAGQAAQEGIGLSAGLGFLKMSRGAEREADLMGVGILYDAGYDPRAMAQFFEILQAKYGAGGSQFMSDHPNPGNRSEYVDKEIAGFVPKPRYTTNTPVFTSIRQQVNGMHAYSTKEISSGTWKRNSPNETVGGAVNEPTASRTINLNNSATWKTFRGAGFSIDIPSDWQAFGSDQSAMIAPEGGIARSAENGAGSVVSGLLTDLYRPAGALGTNGGIESLVAELARDNPGLRPGPTRRFVAGGREGRVVECDNPQANGGRGERDLIVAFDRSDSSIRYFVFVAPTPDYPKFQPIFDRMLQSIRVQ